MNKDGLTTIIQEWLKNPIKTNIWPDIRPQPCKPQKIANRKERSHDNQDEQKKSTIDIPKNAPFWQGLLGF